MDRSYMKFVVLIIISKYRRWFDWSDAKMDQIFEKNKTWKHAKLTNCNFPPKYPLIPKVASFSKNIRSFIHAVWYDLSRKWIRLKCIIRILSLYLTTFIQGEEFQDSKIQDLKHFWIKMEFLSVRKLWFCTRLFFSKDGSSLRSFGVNRGQSEMANVKWIR